MKAGDKEQDRKGRQSGPRALTFCLTVSLALFLGISAAQCEDVRSGEPLPSQAKGAKFQMVQEPTPPAPPSAPSKSSDEYGNVTEGEVEGTGTQETRIADPIEPWNRAMYHLMTSCTSGC